MSEFFGTLARFLFLGFFAACFAWRLFTGNG